jgi:hypothetical protein
MGLDGSKQAQGKALKPCRALFAIRRPMQPNPEGETDFAPGLRREDLKMHGHFLHLPF